MSKRGFRRRGKLVVVPNSEHRDDKMNDGRLLSHRSDSRKRTDRQTVSQDNDKNSPHNQNLPAITPHHSTEDGSMSPPPPPKTPG
jgi:hypothetical protein